MQFPVAKEGFSFIILSLGLCLLAFGSGLWFLGIDFVVLCAFMIFFFRQPYRSSLSEPDKVYAPADGKIIRIAEEYEPEIFKSAVTRISIFMSVFNVHINYAPISGEVTYVRHARGSFKRADQLVEKETNENNLLGIRNDSGQIAVRQVAGLIARRIVCDCRSGDQLTAGKRFGMVKFGSRVDVFLPSDWQVDVSLGQTVRGVKTVIARRKV